MEYPSNMLGAYRVPGSIKNVLHRAADCSRHPGCSVGGRIYETLRLLLLLRGKLFGGRFTLFAVEGK
jgi:hypothetical protein